MACPSRRDAGPHVNRPRGLRLSVVVPTRDRAVPVARLVEALLADRDVAEVVVVDDGGSDGTWHRLCERATRDPRLRPVRQEAAGAGAARQRGAQEARGDVLLLLDDDVVPPEGLAAAHLRVHAEHDGPVVVVGAMPTTPPARRTVDSVTTEQYVQDYEACTNDWLAHPQTVLDHLWSGHLSLPRTTALKVGLDDREMGALFFEDRDLGLRLRRAGVPAEFRPELQVRHEHVRSLSAFLGDSLRQGRAMVVLHERYPTLVPAPTVRWLAGRAPAPARWLVQTSAGEGPLARALPGLVLRATQVAGRLRAWRVQRLLLVLLRRCGQAAGVAAVRRDLGRRA